MKLFLCLFSLSAWIKVEQLKPYHAHKEEMIKINKGKRFQQAVDAVEEFLRRAKGKDQVRDCSHSFRHQAKGFAWLLADLCRRHCFPMRCLAREQLCPELYSRGSLF